jgi:predicted ester cyclase
VLTCISFGYPVAHLLIRKHYDYFNQRRFADGAELFAVDAVLEHPPFGQTRHGRDGYLNLVQSWVQAFPDGQMQIEHVEQRGDTICEVDLIGTGTHNGDFDMGGYGVFNATGLKTTLRFRELLEIRGGLITYSSLTFNVHDLIRQLTQKGSA